MSHAWVNCVHAVHIGHSTRPFPKQQVQSPGLLPGREPTHKNKQNYCTMKYTLLTLASLASLSVSANAQAYDFTTGGTQNINGVNITYTPMASSPIAGDGSQILSVNSGSEYDFGTLSWTGGGILFDISSLNVFDVPSGSSSFEELNMLNITDPTAGDSFSLGSGHLWGAGDQGIATSRQVRGTAASADPAVAITTANFANSGSLTFRNTSTASTGAIILGNFRGQAVPEVSSTALLGLGGLALILRRRK